MAVESERVVEIERRIDAPREVVFVYLTDPDKYTKWMGMTADLDPRPGGVYRVRMNSDLIAVGEYLAVEPPSRVVFTWGWEGDEVVSPGSTRVEITLREDGDGTILRLRHTGFPTGQGAARHREGWNLYVERLSQAAPGGDPGPDPTASSHPEAMASTATVLSQIDRAFADSPRPADDQLLHPDAHDDNDIKSLYGVAHWHDLSDEAVEFEYAALFFLGPAGFRHFLPAYMSFALRHQDGGAAVVGSTVYALRPAQGDLREFSLSKFDLFDQAQRKAVLAFLEAMAGHEDVDEAIEHWRSAVRGGSAGARPLRP